MPFSKVLNLIPGHTFCARGRWPHGVMLTVWDHLSCHLRLTPANRAVWQSWDWMVQSQLGRLLLNRLQSSVGNSTARLHQTASASYDTFTLLDSFLKSWFMDFTSCSQEKLAQILSCHIQGSWAMALEVHGVSQEVSPWSGKLALRVRHGSKI